MRLAIALALAVAVSPILGYQGRTGGDGAGRGAPGHGPNAIVGRVTNQEGRPIQNVFVTALYPRSAAADGERPFSFVSALLHTVTDANGQYRLDGLSIGDYFVVALPKNDPGTPRQPTRVGYGKTFYPSAAEVQHAGTVHVAGTAPTEANVRLVSARLAIVSGLAIGASGDPVGGTLALTHGDGLFGLDSTGYRLPPSGAFAIPAVPPGTYFLVLHESTWPPPQGDIPAVSQAKVIVSGDDVKGVRVVPIHMVQASGRLVVDAVARATAGTTKITIGATPVNFDGNPGPQRAGDVQPDLRFSFKTWPSTGRVRVFPEDTWAIKSIRLNGADVTNSPIDFVEGHEIKGLEVEVVRRTRGRGAAPSTRR